MPVGQGKAGHVLLLPAQLAGLLRWWPNPTLSLLDPHNPGSKPHQRERRKERKGLREALCPSRSLTGSPSPGHRARIQALHRVPGPEGELFWHCLPGPWGACMASPSKGAEPRVREPWAQFLALLLWLWSVGRSLNPSQAVCTTMTLGDCVRSRVCASQSQTQGLPSVSRAGPALCTESCCHPCAAPALGTIKAGRDGLSLLPVLSHLGCSRALSGGEPPRSSLGLREAPGLLPTAS